MTAKFSRSGITFQYPTNWTCDVEADELNWVATVQSPSIAFAIIARRTDAEEPNVVADELLESFKEDYKELDQRLVIEPLAGRPAVGYDLDFLTIDTPTSCRLRAIDVPAGVLMVMTQHSEFDRDPNEIVLSAICASLEIEDD